MSVRKARIGDILERRRDPVEVVPGERYRRIGIYSWGRGMIQHPAADGSEMGSLRYYTFPAGALVLSNIQAWEAAVAVSSSDEAEGFVASNRFLPYVPRDQDLVDVTYLAHYFVSEDGLDQLRRASPGTQVRNRTLGTGLFEAIEVPLPPIEEQRRIATHLNLMGRTLVECERRRIRLDIRQTMRRVAREALEPLRDRWDVGVDVDIFGGGTPVDFGESQGSVPWATPTDLGPLLGRTLSATTRSVHQSFVPRRGPIPRGSVVMTSRAPIGNLAIAGMDLVTNQGCKSFVPRVEADPRFLYFSVMSRFDDYIAAGSGTTFQEVSAARIKTVALPAAPLPQQMRIAEKLATVEQGLWEVARHQNRSAALHKSLLPAVRNEVFSSLR